MVGYEERSKAYRVYDIEARKIVVFRDVNFDESCFRDVTDSDDELEDAIDSFQDLDLDFDSDSDSDPKQEIKKSSKPASVKSDRTPTFMDLCAVLVVRLA